LWCQRKHKQNAAPHTDVDMTWICSEFISIGSNTGASESKAVISFFKKQ
jgi:hypothetical protein